MHLITTSKLIFSIIFSFFLFVTPSFAQTKGGFATDPSIFIKEFGDFFAASKTKDVIKLKKDFSKEFNSLFLPEEKDSIIAFVNTLKARRYRAQPEFVAYVKLITTLKKETSNPNGLRQWHQVAKRILKEDKKPDKTLKAFIQFMPVFLTEKSFKEKKKGGIIWEIKGGTYQVEYANKILLLDFKDINLISTRRKDSLIINQTSGQYFIKSKIWKGNGGTISWSNAELDDVISTLASYQIDCKKGLYSADSVTVSYPYLSSEPLFGQFSDKVGNSGKRAQYPKFKTYSNHYTLKNIHPGVTIQGGIKLDGNKIYVVSQGTERAIFSYHKPQNGEKSFVCKSKLFQIRKDEKVSGEQVETAIFFKEDSIYHPSVSLSYLLKDNKLRLTRANRGSDRNPFFNSFYQVNISADKITFDINQDKIIVGDKNLSIDKIEDEVNFESVNFFDEATYLRYQGVSETNPISILLRLSTSRGQKTFTESEITAAINPKIGIEGNKRLLFQLASDGFIFYDSENEQIILREKLFHYGRASTGNEDYDPINIVSQAKKANAVFDIKKGHTDINNVKSIELSHKQKVAIKPNNKSLQMLKNRDMEFGGTLFAGMSVFYGKGMYFNYDKFDVEMDSIRFLDFYVPTGKLKKNKQKEAISMDSRIEYLTGYLLVDAPQNKSGRKDIPMFPSIVSKEKSYVFYDRKDIHAGVYTRDSFYFELDKFTFNSLDDFEKDDLRFKGNLISARILPKFKETLVVRDDLSLGFEHSTPASGYPLYDANGKYTGDIDLSNKGFLGKGVVQYLTASVQSEDILFKPKEMFCTAKEFLMTEDRTSPVKVPKAIGVEVKVHWLPYQDSMYISTKDKPFDLFKAPNYSLNGTLVLTPKGAKGKGLFDWAGGELRSKIMDLQPFAVHADTANLRIKAIGESGIALNTNNLNGVLDFDKMIGAFEANSDSIVTTLPQNQYQTTMNKFDWDMRKALITFKSKPGKVASFTSIHKAQDSLTFNGETAEYNLNTAELKIGGVSSIQTCDAYIYPSDGKINIQKGAKINTLHNARIIANTQNKYHEFTRVTVDISGRKDYKAKGYYLYNLPNKDQEILFEDIIGQRMGKGAHSEKNTITTATTDVDLNTNFYIDELTKFKGTISLRASEKKLDFDGFAHLDIPFLANKWFSIHSKGDKKNLVINLKKPKNPAGQPLAVGIFLSKETAKIYPSFIQPLHLRKDRPILDCMGQFKFNKTDQAFIFGDSTRVNKYGQTGNVMSFFTSDNTVIADGKLNLGSGLQYMNIDAAGIVQTKISNDSTDGWLKAELLAAFEFDFPEALIRVIQADIEGNLIDLNETQYSKKYFSKVLPNMISNRKDLVQTKNSMASNSLRLPKSFSKYKVVFSKLDMRWMPDYQSFMTTSNKNDLATFNGHPVNKKIRSYVEIKMPSNDDDRVYIYLRLPNNNFYFFGYQGGVLSTCSNNPLFLTTADKMKEKQFIFKKGKGKNRIFAVEIVNPLTAELFVKRVSGAVQGL